MPEPHNWEKQKVKSSETEFKQLVTLADPEREQYRPDVYEFSGRSFKERRNPYENFGS